MLRGLAGRPCGAIRWRCGGRPSTVHAKRSRQAGEAIVSEIVRFSVSLEDELLEQFDRYCAEEHIATRSEALRQVIRDTLTRRAWADDTQEVAGTLTLVYDHHRPQLRDKLVELQHDHTSMIVATLHATRPSLSKP